MNKPTKIVFSDGSEMSFKAFCIEWKAKFAWINGVKHVLPEEWLNEIKD